MDQALAIGVVGYHLIQFSREALRGEHNASFYSAQARRNAEANLQAEMESYANRAGRTEPANTAA
jgi:hypothetical protein